MTSLFISNNIPASPAYAVYISQLIHYSGVCAQYIDFLDRTQLQMQKLLKQGYVSLSLRSSLQTFYGRHHDLIYRNIHISHDNCPFFLRCSFFPSSQTHYFHRTWIYIYIYMKIKENSVGIRFLSCQVFVLPSTEFELTPLIHCSTNRLALSPAP